MRGEDMDHPLTGGKASAQMMDGAQIGKIRRPRNVTEIKTQPLTNGRMMGLSRRMADLIRLLRPHPQPIVAREGRIMVGKDPDLTHLTCAIGVEKAAIICIQVISPERISPRPLPFPTLLLSSLPPLLLTVYIM
eukprot:5918270-Karenia_brevis.AAC.1